MEDNNPIILTFPVREDKKPMKGQIDELFNEIEEYRKSLRFKEILNFCTNFRELSSYNAMLVALQYPGCKYALTMKEWAQKFNRGVRPNARPILYLNYSPLGVLFDISDTFKLGVGAMFPDDEDILDKVAHPFDHEGSFNNRLLHILIGNLGVQGIAYDDKMEGSDLLSANIRPLDSVGKLYFKYRKKEEQIRTPMSFLISINRHAGEAQQFASLCHELGHFFCRHIAPDGIFWWKKRELEKVSREFEAEIVAYLVCRRNGIPNQRSERYLAEYLGLHEEIPSDISVETIMNAVKYIEDMMKEPIPIKDGLLYKKDKRLQDLLDTYKSKPKRNRREAPLLEPTLPF